MGPVDSRGDAARICICSCVCVCVCGVRDGAELACWSLGGCRRGKKCALRPLFYYSAAVQSVGIFMALIKAHNKVLIYYGPYCLIKTKLPSGYGS